MTFSFFWKCTNNLQSKAKQVTNKYPQSISRNYEDRFIKTVETTVTVVTLLSSPPPPTLSPKTTTETIFHAGYLWSLGWLPWELRIWSVYVDIKIVENNPPLLTVTPKATKTTITSRMPTMLTPSSTTVTNLNSPSFNLCELFNQKAAAVVNWHEAADQ